MKHVLDASVAVAALRSDERFHVAALAHCRPFFARRDDVVVPAIFDIEVTSALVRRGADPADVATMFRKHLSSRKLVPIGPRVVRAVRGIVSATKLRAADALYVWVAQRDGVPLVTVDDEILARAAIVGVTARKP